MSDLGMHKGGLFYKLRLDTIADGIAVTGSKKRNCKVVGKTTKQNPTMKMRFTLQQCRFD